MTSSETSSTPLLRRPAARWLLPLLALVVFVGAGSVVSALTNAARADLAPRSAAQLLVDIQKAKLAGLSGTVVENADLGLPALPGNLTGAGSDLASLVTGSHTLRTWYAGPKHARLSLVGQFGESDLIRNGSDLWTWSSSDKSAHHWVVPDQAKASDDSLPTQALTPQQAADKALDAISPSTRVTTNGTATVAGRSAYLLTLEPRTGNTLVDSVQIAIDGKTHVPTRVQLFARGKDSPAFSVGFTSFNPTKPSMSVFGFNPPPGTKVTREHGHPTSPMTPGKAPAESHAKSSAKFRATFRSGHEPSVVGSGWSRVIITRLPQDALTGGSSKGSANSLNAVIDKLPKVSGSWGSGRLLRGSVFSALLTDDGRVVAGAVPPRTLYAALAAR